MPDGTAQISARELIRLSVEGCFQRAGGDEGRARRLYRDMLPTHPALLDAVTERDFQEVTRVNSYTKRKPNADGDGHAVLADQGPTARATPSAPHGDGGGQACGARKGRVPSAPPSPTFDAAAAHRSAIAKAETVAARAIFKLHDGKDIADVTFGSLQDYLAEGAAQERQAQMQQAIIRIILRDYPSAKPGQVVGQTVPAKMLRNLLAQARKECAP